MSSWPEAVRRLDARRSRRTGNRRSEIVMELTGRWTQVRDTVARGRWPATAVFFLNGLALATFLVRLPSLKATFHLTNGQVGAVGLLFAASALISMQFVGRLVAGYGSARIIRVGLLLMPLALAAIGLASSPVTYAAASVALGAVHGTIDVAMNALAVGVERRLVRPILNGCHAAWSISAVTASLTGAALIHAGASTTSHLVGVAGVLLVAALGLGPLLATSADAATRTAPADQETVTRNARRGQRGAGWREGWTRTVVRLGLTGTGLMICEGATLGWSGIFLHDSRGATLAVASMTVTVFTGCQTAGRVVGDRLRLRYGDRALFRVGGLVGTAGFMLAIFGPSPVIAIAGFAVVGLGTSVLIPMTFSAVGHAAEGEHGTTTFLARFTTFTYAGILLGPAVIGWAAQLVGLQWTLAALIPILGCIALASLLPRGDRAAGIRCCG
jgi:MFS family permease